jgi:hypothetical protein
MTRLTATVLLLAVTLCMIVGHADAQISTVFSNECTKEHGMVWVTGYPSSCSGLLTLMKQADAYIDCSAPNPVAEASQLQIEVISSGLAFDGFLWPNDKCNGNSANVWVCHSNRSVKTAILPMDMVKFGQAVIQKDQAALSQMLDVTCSAMMALM